MLRRIVFLKGILITLRAGQLLVPEKALRQIIDIQSWFILPSLKTKQLYLPAQKQD